MEHLQEILKVWADLDNKPSKSQNEKRIMDDLAALLGRRCGEPCLHKMRVVRAGGDPFPGTVTAEQLTAVVKKVSKAVKDAPHITGFVDAPVEQFTGRETEIESFVDSQEEKKSPQSSAGPVNVAEVKRGRKAKIKE